MVAVSTQQIQLPGFNLWTEDFIKDWFSGIVSTMYIESVSVEY